ncbi:MAG: FtsX-like permease family protein [Dehalococcoidia bacterium]|nr:FtsX-like permease family protein [Dehalococcoidia bacterium]
MGSLAVLWALLLRHVFASWRMLAVLALGVLVASTLLASAPIYARAMADLGLKFTVRDELRGEPSIRAGIEAQQLATPDSLAVREAVERRIDERLGWFALERSVVVESARLTIGRTGEESRTSNPLGVLYALEGFEQHVTVLEGHLPTPGGPGAPLEVAMGARAAAVARLAPGDHFLLIEEIDNCDRIIPQGLQPQLPCDLQVRARYAVPAVLTGIIAVENPDASFWAAISDRYVMPSAPIADSGLVSPMVAHVDAVLGDLAVRYPGQKLTLRWNVLADIDQLDQGNFERAREDILALNQDLRIYNGYATSQLTVTLDAFGRSADFQRAPLTILLIQIAAIALFYVALISVAVVERQGEQIALLRGRGSSTAQVVGLYALEGLALGLPAILVAPFIAAGVTALLGFTPVFSDISGGQPLPVSFDPLAFPLAALGAALSIVALTAPAFLVARRGPQGQRRALARPTAGLIQRYYLDVVLVGFALLALWELNERNSVYTPSATGGVTSDPLLLASPALIIAAAAAVLARLYPIALRAVVAVAGRVAGVAVAMGLWQLVRRPGPYTQLALLLMMAVAVGMFAASYTSTTERSYEDRARFSSGVEVRALAGDTTFLPADPTRLEDQVGGIEGVDDVSAVLRLQGAIATPNSSGPEVAVLAIGGDAGDLLWWREDFADRPLEAILDRVDSGEILRGMPIPPGSTELSVWVNPALERATVTIWARVRDATGRHDLLPFGKLDFKGWQEMRAVVHDEQFRPLQEPLVLVALILTEPANQFNASDEPVYIDDLSSVDPDGTLNLLEGFEGVVRWEAVPSAERFTDSLQLSREEVRSGSQAARLGFRRGTTGERRGLFPADRGIPMPILASEAFLERNRLEVGDEDLLEIDNIIVPVVVRGVYERFPTLPALDGPSVVLNRDQLLRWGYMVSTVPGDLSRANEVWLDLAPDADRWQIFEALDELGLRRVVDQEATLEAVRSNPLIAASGTGILSVSFVATLVLVAVALLVSLWMAIQRRRVEFAVLGAIGLTRRQVMAVLGLEYAIVGVVGVAAGVLVGQFVGRRMLSFLDVTEAGLPVEPGFVLQTEWTFVIVGAAAVAAVFAVALVATVQALSRTSDAAVLRTE